ncbi:unnamed protein product [Anisakis simplex]|uniref:Secreted protein n=1 Tax=Anisakis simplex TaxID=6269 RepID=A0A0M3J091_ANISI|nr:unnamed protein product [Anisakis simplex]
MGRFAALSVVLLAATMSFSLQAKLANATGQVGNKLQSNVPAQVQNSGQNQAGSLVSSNDTAPNNRSSELPTDLASAIASPLLDYEEDVELSNPLPPCRSTHEILRIRPDRPFIFKPQSADHMVRIPTESETMEWVLSM